MSGAVKVFPLALDRVGDTIVSTIYVPGVCPGDPPYETAIISPNDAEIVAHSATEAHAMEVHAKAVHAAQRSDRECNGFLHRTLQLHGLRAAPGALPAYDDDSSLDR